VYEYSSIGLYLKMDIQSAEGQKLEDTVLSVLARNLGLNHHIFVIV